MSKFDLTGKIAVVTGAGQGLGESFARSLSEAGATVCLMARNEERLKATAEKIANETGNPTRAYGLDITNEENVKDKKKKVKEDFGRIDILVNNAAVGRSDTPLTEETLDSWNAIMTTNVTGTFLMMKHFGKIMLDQKQGKVINLASMSGRIANRNPVIGAYDVSKAAVECLTRIMGATWAEHGVTVNAICPGYYMTDINKAYIAEHPDFYEDSLNQIPLKTWGKPENIGDIAVFLASPASDYMTGETIVTDGGYTAW